MVSNKTKKVPKRIIKILKQKVPKIKKSTTKSKVSIEDQPVLNALFLHMNNEKY